MLSFILHNCDSNKNLPEIGTEQDPNFYLSKKLKISSSLPLSDSNFLISTDDSLFYFTNFFTKKIYKTTKPFIDQIELGNNGNGPGEYQVPVKVFPQNNSLYFSDMTNSFIKNLNLSGKPAEGSHYITNSGGAEIVVDDKYLYAFTFTNPHFHVYDKTSGELIKSLIELDEYYKRFNYRLGGGGISKDKEGNIYVLNAAPNKIFKINKRNSEFYIDKIIDLEYLLNGNNWTEAKFNKYNSINSKKNKNQLMNEVLRIEKMVIIGNKEQYFFISIISSREKKFIILDLGGKVLNHYSNNNLTLIGKSPSSLYFFNTEERQLEESEIYLYEYKLKL